MERQVAMKIWLNDLAQGTYVRVGGEWDPNFIQTPDGRKFSRVNVLAVVATEPAQDANYHSFIVDDGTARVSIRIFEELKTEVALGDVVRVIGRPREFNNETYIVPEIIKKVENHKWVEHRKLELGKPVALEKPVGVVPEQVNDDVASGSVEKPVEQVNDVVPEKPVEPTNDVEKVVDPVALEKPVVGPVNNVEKVIEVISKLDSGEGADAEDVISESKIANCETIIDNLLKEGEIFEISSGKLKVLE